MYVVLDECCREGGGGADVFEPSSGPISRSISVFLLVHRLVVHVYRPLFELRMGFVWLVPIHTMHQTNQTDHRATNINSINSINSMNSINKHQQHQQHQQYHEHAYHGINHAIAKNDIKYPHTHAKLLK